MPRLGCWERLSSFSLTWGTLPQLPPEIARLVRCSSIDFSHTRLESDGDVRGILSELAVATRQATGGDLQRDPWLGWDGHAANVAEIVGACGGDFCVHDDYDEVPDVDGILSRQDYDGPIDA